MNCLSYAILLNYIRKERNNKKKNRIKNNMNITSKNEIKNLQSLFTNMSEGIRNGHSLLSLKSLVEQYQENDWKKYVKFNNEKYARNIIYQDDVVEFVVISWKKGQESPIHDHPNNGCLLKMCSGKLREKRFSNNGGLHKISDFALYVNDVGYIDNSLCLHSICAIDDSVSLHIYSPPNYKCNTYIL